MQAEHNATMYTVHRTGEAGPGTLCHLSHQGWSATSMPNRQGLQVQLGYTVVISVGCLDVAREAASKVGTSRLCLASLAVNCWNL